MLPIYILVGRSYPWWRVCRWRVSVAGVRGRREERHMARVRTVRTQLSLTLKQPPTITTATVNSNNFNMLYSAPSALWVSLERAPGYCVMVCL